LNQRFRRIFRLFGPHTRIGFFQEVNSYATISDWKIYLGRRAQHAQRRDYAYLHVRAIPVIGNVMRLDEPALSAHLTPTENGAVDLRLSNVSPGKPASSLMGLLRRRP
jgi:hypothetical protein